MWPVRQLLGPGALTCRSVCLQGPECKQPHQNHQDGFRRTEASASAVSILVSSFFFFFLDLFHSHPFVFARRLHMQITKQTKSKILLRRALTKQHFAFLQQLVQILQHADSNRPLTRPGASGLVQPRRCRMRHRAASSWDAKRWFHRVRARACARACVSAQNSGGTC